ncbi:hypothetical protein J14TS5_11450 [Paenibacillus lautus]|uniref:DUF4830 domain-containing protein n=1 Tax=Paenibacillus lautus TaxID=1401 RepID=UPI001B199387|nr:DUF4830 domain-containing protein [Paenibacillus lautus]GIO96059.1 hypothetical protein J14TS5_11450 [Paenibacillus lautus]
MQERTGELKLKLLFILMLVILVGCNKEDDGVVVIETYKEQHIKYLDEYGWSIDRFGSETKYAAHTLQSFKSHVKDIKELGHVDLTPFLDKEVIETGYILQEKTMTYNQIVGYILESGNEIIGGYLVFNHEAEQADGTLHIDQSNMNPILHRKELGSDPPSHSKTMRSG